MIKKFRGSKIALSVAEGKLYDETTTFNEQNIKEYLAEVEEYIKCLLTVMANQFGVKCPILVPLGLDELPKKIEPPVFPREHMLNTDDDEEPNEVTLNDMLNKTKFDSMMMEILGRRKETSKIMDEESKVLESERQKPVEKKEEEKKEEKKREREKRGGKKGSLIKQMAGVHMVDDMAMLISDDEEKEVKDEAKVEEPEETGEAKDEVKKE